LLEDWNVKQVIAEGEKHCLGCTVWKVVQHVSLERFLQMGLRGLINLPLSFFVQHKVLERFLHTSFRWLIFHSISLFQDIILERFFTWV
jgi:hypothetical protein